jgi:hypothetical protein
MNRVLIKPACQAVQEVGAVKRIIWSAVARRHFETIIEFEKLAGLHVARVNSRREVSDRSDLFANPNRLQRFNGLRACVYGGADLAQCRSGLENLSLDPEDLERVRDREPGEPAADDRHPAA